VADTLHNRIQEFNEKGEYLQQFGSAGAGNGQFAEPSGVYVDSKGDVWVADTHNARVQEFNEKLAYVKQIDFAKASQELPRDVAGETNGDVWISVSKGEASGYAEEVNTEGKVVHEVHGTAVQTPSEVAVDSAGDVWVANRYGDDVAEYSEAGKLLKTMGSLGTGGGEFDGVFGIAIGSTGVVWVADHGNNRIQKWTRPVEGEGTTPQAGATVEYDVPLSGLGLQSVTKEWTGKWGQTDDPVEGAAIFPPTKPQGWPASNYEGATVYYMDNQARTVNVEAPSGGVATSEYNSENDVTRSLSPDNRAAALKEECKSEKECKSAEVAASLSTESVYTEGRLTETRGPQHIVKLAAGKEGKPEETLARNHVKYYYDEGAPKNGETYDLVTKTEDGAETASKEEFDKRSATTSYSGQSNLGWELREPTSATAEPGGLSLTSTTKYEKATGDVIETQTPAASGKDTKVPLAYSLSFGSYGAGAGQLDAPEHDAIDSHGDLWVADYDNERLDEYSSAGKFMMAVGWGVKNGKAEAETCTTECGEGIAGSGNGQFNGPVGIAVNPTTNDVYVADDGNSRIEEFSPAGAWIASIGSKGAAGGDFSSPQGVTIDSSGDVWVADYANNRIQELSPSGTFMLAIGWGVKDGKAEAETCTSSCEAGISGSGNGQMTNPAALAFSGGDVYVADYSNSRIDEFSTAGAYVSKFGAKGTTIGEFEGPHDIATEAATGDLYVDDQGNNRIQKFTAAGTFLSTFGADRSGNGQLEHPDGMTITPAGAVYVSDSLADRIEEWAPTTTGNEGAHDTKTIYYTAKAEAEVPACREHPEWVDLVCEVVPVAQPGTSGLPELPTKTITYNMWDQAETITETFGTITRTKTTHFDSGGRPLETEETSSNDTSLPPVVDKYNTTNGTLETQTTTVGETKETLTSIYNKRGELESYTDAAANTAKYTYDEDGRVATISDGSAEGAGKQTYTYNETTGALTKLVDSAAGTFTASYDVEGKMTSEGYPNGMTAFYTYSPAGSATALEYKKLTDCTEKCTWFSDTLTPSIHGETMKQTSSLSEEPSYTYDAAGRLTQVQEIPAGEGCTTRLYAYEEDSNRTSLTTRSPGTEGHCATEGGTTEWHTYDTADRLTDPGITYEPFGNITILPAADAGGSEITSKYYIDSQLYKQTQGEQTSEYKLDPEDRTLETITSGKTEAKIVTHYDGPGSAPTWTSEESGKTWTREIPGIGGELAATQTPTKITLQLHDLQGNIIGTAGNSETETKLQTTYNSTEFGVPQPGTTPPKYAWLGAAGIASEPSSTGRIVQDGVTYVPQIGRSLQTPESITLGLPNNSATPYTSPVVAAVAAYGAATSAQEVAKREQENSERVVAADPPGAIPSPEEGQSLEEFFNGSDGGTGASAAGANPCKLGLVFGETSPQELFAGGSFSCHKDMRAFELETCILWEKDNEGHWSNLECNEEHGHSGQVFNGQSSGKGWVKDEFCPIGLHFFGWVWGDVLGPGGYQVKPIQAQAITCTGDGSQEFYEKMVEFLQDGSGALPGT
jgi:YD repeat-containing protein